MNQRNLAREQVWCELRKVARPDSRFHYNFSQVIPDYEGGEEAVHRLVELPVYQEAKLVFITPDNNLSYLRRLAINDEKVTIMSTYGINRGFLQITRADVPQGQEAFASTLDGMEQFARPISLPEITQLGQLDLLVTGASAITLDGIRFGKGHGFFDLEWAMLREIGVCDGQSPVAAVAHDCQVIDLRLTPEAHDTIVDYIITPTRTIQVSTPYPKPSGLNWEILPEKTRLSIPPLQQLFEQQRSTS